MLLGYVMILQLRYNLSYDKFYVFAYPAAYRTCMQIYDGILWIFLLTFT